MFLRVRCDLEVRFDGVPAGIVQTAPGRVVVALPRGSKRGGNAPGLSAAVQLFYNGEPSNVVMMPVVSARPGILNYVANVDGMQNGPDHPAASGSTVTLFVTGLGSAPPPLYSTWQRTPATPLAAQPLPGYLPAVWQVQLTTPSTSGRTLVALRFSQPASSSPIAESNYVDVYVN